MSIGIENNLYNSKYNNQVKSKTKKDNIKNKEKENVQASKSDKSNEEILIDEQLEEFKNNCEQKDVIPDKYQIINSLLSLNSGVKSSVIIDPKVLRKMNEPEIAEKLKTFAEEIPKVEKMMQSWYKSANIEVISHGWIIDKDGNLSGWSITKTKEKKKDYTYWNKERLEKMRKEKKEKERLEKKREEKKTEKKRQEKKLEKKKLEKKDDEKRKVKKSQINNAKRYNDSKLRAINMSIINITR